MLETQGVLLGNFVAIRDIVDAAVEKAVQYKGTDYIKGATEILNDAANKVNTILQEYLQIYGQ